MPWSNCLCFVGRRALCHDVQYNAGKWRIHWYGVQQFNTPGMDGGNDITERPLAPGEMKTYTVHVTHFGSSWNHAHFSSQYGDGPVGPIMFDGPASAKYDVYLGPYTLSDWYYVTPFQMDVLASSAPQFGDPLPPADNILINGTNKKWRNRGGGYNQGKITKSKKYRLRLINHAVDNYIRVSLNGHLMQVMTTGFVPIEPFRHWSVQRQLQQLELPDPDRSRLRYCTWHRLAHKCVHV